MRLGDDVYTDRPPNAAFASDAVEELPWKKYNKLMRCTRGPYMLTEVQTHTVVINENQILNQVTTDGVTPVHQFPQDTSRATTDSSQPRS